MMRAIFLILNVWLRVTDIAQEAYSALSIEQSSDYDLVKEAILRVSELVPVIYHQHFRSHMTQDKQTCVEFAREKENLFDWWRLSQKLDSTEQLRQLIRLDRLLDFMNCTPEAVCAYLNELKAVTLDPAIKLEDAFVLTHKINFVGQFSTDRRRNLLPKAQLLKQTASSVSKKLSLHLRELKKNKTLLKPVAIEKNHVGQPG